MSEDLDFGVSIATDASRTERSKRVEPIKQLLDAIEARTGALRYLDPLRGFHNSTQYANQLAYHSAVTGQDDFIRFEVSVRELVVEPPKPLPARTLLLDPFRRAPAVRPFDVAALTRREAYAEKLRAALSRREPAIRDFFDLHHAFSVGVVGPGDTKLARLVKQKLGIRGNEPVDLSPQKLDALRRQLETQLKPVLRVEDFTAFDLDRAYSRIADFAARL